MQELSARLCCVAGLVRAGGCLCDIGTDHAWLPIALLERGQITSAIAMDVRPGPLAIAREHIGEAGVSDRIQTRLSDGLSALAAGEADSIVAAGMGGMLIRQILLADLEKAYSAKEWILQPQSDAAVLRGMLRQTDFSIAEEELVMDRGKLYVVIRAVPRREIPAFAGEGSSTFFPAPDKEKLPDDVSTDPDAGHWEQDDWNVLGDRFGPMLLRRRHPLLLEWLQKEESRLSALLDKLQVQDSPEAKQRYEQLRGELGLTRKALELWQSKQ